MAISVDRKPVGSAVRIELFTARVCRVSYRVIEYLTVILSR